MMIAYIKKNYNVKKIFIIHKMGQAPIKDNIFRDGIILGFCLDGVNITKAKPYPNGLNYGLIIKPLYLEMKFRFPYDVF